VLIDHSGERHAWHWGCADVEERQGIKASRGSKADVAG
jgi:hypothetical protein